MTKRIGMPAGHYYGPAEDHRFWDEGSNPSLCGFGQRMRLPCGGAWICGDAHNPFAVEILYAADSYNHMARVLWYDERSPKWNELRGHLVKYLGTTFSTQTAARVRQDLGLPNG